MSVTPSVIVTTYNRPRELGLVLCGLSMQQFLPEEILIADDGSTRETTELIKTWNKKIKIPVRHIWHEDIGNRKSQICNKAVDAAQGDYLIFLDGDSIPHPLWVRDHVTAAREGKVLCGRRVRLGPEVSCKIDIPFVQAGKLWRREISWSLLVSVLQKDTKRYMLGIRLPRWIFRLFHPKERRLMGVNFSLHKKLFERVGGYSSPRDGYIPVKERRREDAELEIRLISVGISRFPLLNRAVVYHLYHSARPPNEEVDAQIQARYARILKQRN